MQRKNQNNKHKKGSKIKSQNSKLCKLKPDNFLLNDNYLVQISSIIKENQ